MKGGMIGILKIILPSIILPDDKVPDDKVLSCLATSH